ncbi:hypothetical protein Gocc_1443 [Gaiella occulta]|uniref:Uncharacterized protein n=1 Tax=Gaiella occulta TaxID=1002870 RepID=A0A7M2YXF8_9ACTN|nr:hypothetical protein [Gaiella occulta]RDI74554.1 hypothetical protein Gocc_1443 [Gaiella occulta]
MPFGVGIGQVVAVVRDARGFERHVARVALAGPRARELAAALAAGGDPGAVAVEGDPAAAAAAVRIVDGAPTEADVAFLRRAARAGVPLLVVVGREGRPRTGSASRIPYVLPQDTIELDGDGSLAERVARSLARAVGGGDAAALARRLPALRPHVEHRLVRRAALAGAAVAAAPWVEEAHLPLLTLAQARMLLELGVAAGSTLPRDPQALATAAGPAVAASFGTGLALRSLYRRLPVRGPLAAAALAYAGTRALGELRTRV